ncbi:MAG TPA: VIT1/CCC1 transporter family protein [Pyrinomonadaceae bacterium]|jgi:VIT1/CCC1 family predicted Fe2+/Mn2+ transporter|nr:VIT1/CCC1 transporter family protein [Pyrinomonadaceae bacterium]
MPQTPHTERHFTASDVVRDIVIGMSDGLTVPFALAAGLTGGLQGAANPTAIIVTAGLAEIAAGSIAMGLGGYLAARSDAEHYAREREREKREVAEIPHEEMREVAEVFQEYGLTLEQTWPIVEALRKQPKKWIDFMMRFELGLERPDPKRALTSAVTIGGAYAAGGFVPLAPYMFTRDATGALFFSIGVTLATLFVFGFIKGRFTGTRPMRSALQTALIGSAAAGAAFLLARSIS